MNNELLKYQPATDTVEDLLAEVRRLKEEMAESLADVRELRKGADAAAAQIKALTADTEWTFACIILPMYGDPVIVWDGHNIGVAWMANHEGGADWMSFCANIRRSKITHWRRIAPPTTPEPENKPKFPDSEYLLRAREEGARLRRLAAEAEGRGE